MPGMPKHFEVKTLGIRVSPGKDSLIIDGGDPVDPAFVADCGQHTAAFVSEDVIKDPSKLKKLKSDLSKALADLNKL